MDNQQHIKQFPQFIQNKPCGIDKFDGGSQERLAKTIARHFCQNDALKKESTLPRIIGIEGVWGSGKSNVVKMLEKELAEGYYFFEYDAWGHQEDLQRRSILELLTSKLISDNILSGDTTITIKGGGKKSVTWSEKLKYLLARKTETVTEKYPLISNGMVAAFLVAVLTPIFTFIAYAVKPANTTWWFSLLSIIIASLPVLIALAIWRWAYHKDNKYGLSYLLAIYQDKVENDICYETLSVDEPTVYEFKTWMQDISDFIKENNKPKLVLVFDNMDRLPAEKVKELWSSIHTFFADSGFENIWAVIPFDETHLACAFGDKSEEETKQLTKYFINKTFPIVYRVAPPVITDYRNVFNKLFVEAFGEESDSTETINRIFRLVHPNANVREIISFINEMVALCQEWGNEISIINIALFCLKKAEILSNPVEQILSGKYLNGIQAIINNDLRTQCEIAALVYGVDIEHAKQIPLTKYIEGCINEEEDHDINQYAESNKLFDVVLDEVVKGMDDTLINKIIHCLHTLTRKNDAILHIWQLIAQRKLKDTLEKQLFPVEYQELLLHLDEENQSHVIAQLYKKIVRFKEFNGADYFKSLNEIEQFIEEKKLTCDFVSLIEPKEVEPKIFIDYIRAANRSNIFIRSNVTAKAYNYYLVKTTSADLDSYLANLLPDKFEYTDIIRTLKDDSNYSFTILLQTIKDCISNKKVDKNNAGVVFTTYRLLSSNKELPLSVKLDSSYIDQLYSEIAAPNNRNNTESGYYDFVAMQLSLGRSVSLGSDGNIKHVAEVMDYYADHGDMLVNCTRWNIPLLNDVLQYMVNHKLGFRLSLPEILPQYENIKNRIHVTDEAFIEHLAEWNINLDEHINKNNIKNVIPNASFYSLTTQISNSLTDHINKIAIEALSEINTETLYAQRANYSSDYWLVATNHLLAQISSLPDNLTEFAKKILVDISSGNQSINPLPDLFEKIFGMVDRRKVKSTITNIRNEFCNGKVSINSTKFKFFESWLRLYGNLNDRAGEVLDKIVKPIITDSTCQSLILQNKKFYIDLIHTAGDDAYELKNNLKVIVKQNVNEQFIEFINTVITNDEVKDAK